MNRPCHGSQVTLSAHILMTRRAVLSDRVWDGFLAKTYPRPGAPSGQS